MAKAQTALTVQPRVYPAGRSVVLHGFGSAELAGRRFTVEGRRVQALRYGRLALLIAFVAQTEYAPEELERHRADEGWVRIEARVHERAIERASLHGLVVPSRFLSVFPHPAALEEAAAEHYPRWCRTLTRLGTKREFVIHAFAGPHVAPGGEPYVLRVVANASRSPRVLAPKMGVEIVTQLQNVWRTCGALAASSRRIAGPPMRGALGSVAYLVPDSEVGALRAAFAAASQAGTAAGLTFYLEGPRAPFIFG
jgi:hypothetical protein